MEHTTTELALKVKEAGGRAMIVGGRVRDEFLCVPSKDMDVEIYGLEPEKLEEILKTFGKVDNVGASFGVYKLGQDIDVSLPRREKKTGEGHKGFTVEIDPTASFEEACLRRDFTINAIMKDPLTAEVVDPFGGKGDIHNQLLRVVSEVSFQEDSLRVLRLAQFASRLNFNIEQHTRELAKATDLSDLPRERIWMELEKLLMKSRRPSIGVKELQNLRITRKLFPSLKHYEKLENALDMAVQFCNDFSYGEKLTVLVAVLTWVSDTNVLDELGLNSVEGYPVRKEVEKLLTFAPSELLTSDYAYHKLSQRLKMKFFSRVLYAMSSPTAGEFADVMERLGIQDEPVKPLIQGRDLIALGMTPSPEMGEALKNLYDEQLKGMTKEALELEAMTLARVS